MNISSPKIIISKLVLVGHRKNYIIPFSKGLNVIYGDSDTGKSSILNLIDYCFGKSTVDMYDELEMSGKYCLLEVALNNKIFTIKRDIFNNSDNIEVFNSSIEEMTKVFPLEYGPNYNKEGPAGFFSDFLMQALNIPIVKVKRAPSRQDSPLIRLGFRDVFKFCSLDQDEVGSKNILDNKNWSLFIKNKETFKFLHNVLDTQITELQGDISEKTKLKNELENKYIIISSFLRETQIKSFASIEYEIVEVNIELECLNQEIDVLNSEMISSTSYCNELRDVIYYLEHDLNKIDDARYLLERSLDQNQKLKKDYEKDIGKLETANQVKSKLSYQNVKETFCPICNKTISVAELSRHFEDNNTEAFKIEINALKKRKKNLMGLIDKQVNNNVLIGNEKESIINNLNNARSLIDNKTKAIVSPYISQRDGMISQKAKVLERRDKLEYLLKIRKQLDDISENSTLVSSKIDKLTEKLESLKENAPSTKEIISDIGDYLNGFLEFIKIKNCTNISINDKTFLPVVRNKDYIKLTSGGLRTIVSVGYFVSLLINSISSSSNLPSFLMIDTIGKYLGKTKSEYLQETDLIQDKTEGITDPKKYLNIYQYLINMCEETRYNNEFQVIVVDNDIPLEIEKILTEYVVKRFSTESKPGFDIGFIDDIGNYN